MAKQPPVTTDRFRIFAETSSEEMGPLLAQLTKMGLQNIGYELITDVVRFNKNERVVRDTSNEEWALKFVEEHPTFKAIDLVKQFEVDGRTRDSGYATIGRLVEKGLLTRLSPGNYQRADVKAIAPPDQEPKRTGRGQTPRYEVSNDTLLLKYIKGRKRLTVKEAGAFFEDEGRNKKSVSPIISKFTADGLLKQIEPGQYEVVKKVEKPASKKKAHAKLNGPAPSSPGEDANG